MGEDGLGNRFFTNNPNLKKRKKIYFLFSVLGRGSVIFYFTKNLNLHIFFFFFFWGGVWNERGSVAARG